MFHTLRSRLPHVASLPLSPLLPKPVYFKTDGLRLLQTVPPARQRVPCSEVNADGRDSAHSTQQLAETRGNEGEVGGGGKLGERD